METQLLDLSGTGSPYGPPPAAVKALATGVRENSSMLRGQACGAALDYLTDFAEHLGASPAHLLAGRGPDEFLPLLARQLAERSVALVVPEVTDVLGVFRTATLYSPGRRGPWPPDRRLELLRTAMGEHGCVVLSNPNDLGHCLPRCELIRACQDHPECLLILNEERMNADAGPSMAGSPRRNLVVLKAMGPAWGMPGCRLGLLWTRAAELRRAVAAQLPVPPISTLDAAAASAALRESSWTTSMLERTGYDAQVLEQLLVRHFGAAVEATAAPASTRFVHLSDPHDLGQQLLRHGVFARVFSAERGRTPGVRIAAPSSSQDLRRLSSALQAIRPEQLRTAPAVRGSGRGR